MSLHGLDPNCMRPPLDGKTDFFLLAWLNRPILPIVTMETKEEFSQFINSNESPLALYSFTGNGELFFFGGAPIYLPAR